MLLLLYISLIGLMVGSAINAIVWRLKVGRSWARGRSECFECHHVLAAIDLVPVVSWLMLRGRCRYCQTPIKDHPFVELITAVAFGLSYSALTPANTLSWVLFTIWLILLILLIVLAVYDAKWMLLPDKIMIPAISIGFIYVAIRMIQFHSFMPGRGPILAALIGGGFFYALVALSKGRAMGGGDIKLVFLMGLVLGVKGLLLALFLSFDSAALVGLILIGLHLKKRRDHIAFGPFLVGSTVFAFLYGHQIINWYLRLNGLA